MQVGGWEECCKLEAGGGQRREGSPGHCLPKAHQNLEAVLFRLVEMFHLVRKLSA